MKGRAPHNVRVDVLDEFSGARTLSRCVTRWISQWERTEIVQEGARVEASFLFASPGASTEKQGADRKPVSIRVERSAWQAYEEERAPTEGDVAAYEAWAKETLDPHLRLVTKQAEDCHATVLSWFAPGPVSLVLRAEGTKEAGTGKLPLVMLSLEEPKNGAENLLSRCLLGARGQLLSFPRMPRPLWAKIRISVTAESKTVRE